jgi:hypothetical protein
VLPFRGRSTNGIPVSAPAANLDNLFADAPAGGPPAGSFMPAPAPLHVPGGRADSQLSKLTGLAGFMSRNPGLKFVAAGAVVVVLLGLAVIVVLRMPGDQRPPPAPVATVEKPEPPATLDILPGRPADEKPSTKSVAPVSHGPSIGPARGSKGKPVRGQRPSVNPPPPGGLEPAPIGEAPGAAPRVAAGERPVAKYNSNHASAASDSASSGPTDSQIHAVVNKRENQLTIRTCYERALKRDDKIRSGRIESTVEVGPSGIVKSVALNAPAEFGGVEPCIKQAVRRWMFPASSEGYSTQFTLIMQGNL